MGRVTFTPSLGAALSRIGETQVPLSAQAAVLIGVAALAAVGVSQFWLVTRHVGVIAHEGAHAVMGLGTGRVRRVMLNPDGTGTTYLQLPRGSAHVAAGLAGYLGPSAFGLAAAALIAAGHIVAVLWLVLLLLALLLVLLVRTAFGVVLILVIGGLLYLVAAVRGGRRGDRGRLRRDLAAAAVRRPDGARPRAPGGRRDQPGPAHPRLAVAVVAAVAGRDHRRARDRRRPADLRGWSSQARRGSSAASRRCLRCR